MPSPTIDDLSEAQKRVLVDALWSFEFDFADGDIEGDQARDARLRDVVVMLRYGLVMSIPTRRNAAIGTVITTPAGRELAEEIKKEME